MKGNIESFSALKAEVNRIREVKIDRLPKNKELAMDTDGTLNGIDIGVVAHQQISEKLGIPKKYYDRMLAVPDLRRANVNAWLDRQPDQKHLVRVLDNRVRAFLSDRFKPVDNWMIMDSFMPVLEKMDVQVVSSSLTEIRMYLQVVFPGLSAEVTVGDIVQAGVILTNSETGCGAVDVSHVVWRLKCSNGMIGQSVLNKYHVGRRVGDNIQDYDIFQNDTIEAELLSFRKQLRDVLTYSLSQSFLDTQVEKMRKATEDVIEDSQTTVENVVKRFSFNENEGSKILMNLGHESGTKQPTRWDIANSVTALAHSTENPDRQFQFEKAGNDIIEMSKKEWAGITVWEKAS